KAQAALEVALDEQGRAYGVSQGAIVVMAPDGRVRAMVGGRDYAASQFNRAASALRQPGSAFKPIVWLQALQRGLGPETVAQDRPFSWRGWRPANHGDVYRGELSLRRALAYSSNSVAARLIVDGGARGTVDLAKTLGITSDLRAHPSLALGTSEVSLLELTGAYATLASGGLKARPQLVTRVRTRAGEVLYERSPGAPRVVRSAHVRSMNRMLADVVAYGSGKRAALGRPVAGKTGTSQDYRDGWFVGYTAQLAAGVWFGNDDGRPSKEMTGGRLPAETWGKVMGALHEGWRVRPLPGVGAAPPRPAPDAAPQAAPKPAALRPAAAVQSVSARPQEGALTGFLQGLLGR
ncbi:MAG: penicillin-binding transpeptidase domain-containing protein, partial [Pseudomonadota bacterium]